jgi:NTE family protein
LLRHYDHAEQRLEGTPGRILALSGTSGGAMCALLAWYGLLTHESGGRSPAELLDDFWTGNAASEWWDILLNAAVVQTSRLEGYVALPEVSPYVFGRLRRLTNTPVRDWLDTAGRLRRLLEQHVDFAGIPELVQSDLASPRLLVGAVDVTSGEFRVFNSHAEPSEITPEALLASAALPTLFEAVEIGGHSFWDGLFSQNPPIHDFLSSSLSRDAKPDEIWIIQINAETVREVPRTTAEILDRRNELSGNLSLNQEVAFILRLNALIRQLRDEQHQHVEMLPDFKEVRIARITMSPDLSGRLDAASKLDRNPELIRDLVTDGERQADEFLRRRTADHAGWAIS